MEVVVTTGAIKRAKLQSHHHHQQTNTQLFTGAGCPSCRPTNRVRALRGRGKNIVDYSTETVQTRHLSPEDPQRAGDDDGGRDDDIDDEPSGDDRVLGLAWRLLEHVMVNRLHSQTVQTHTHIHRVSEKSTPLLFLRQLQQRPTNFHNFCHRLIYKGPVLLYCHITYCLHNIVSGHPVLLLLKID